MDRKSCSIFWQSKSCSDQDWKRWSLNTKMFTPSAFEDKNLVKINFEPPLNWITRISRLLQSNITGPIIFNSTQNTSVNRIIRLLSSLLCWPKVILISCILREGYMILTISQNLNRRISTIFSTENSFVRIRIHGVVNSKSGRNLKLPGWVSGKTHSVRAHTWKN